MAQTLTELLNIPEVVQAFETFAKYGLIGVPKRATIFCAYCGQHICFGEAVATGPENEQSAFVKQQVAAHRVICVDYQKQITDARQ